ncbi:LysR family transcriptional regulator [Bordetella genomosp. 13]|uniref:LysR family transcriptional regulator n=1 Tax=Bordetella genomosp. 13 TaxID=463040 RepID=A0A1W6Z7P1_9BORD|nr:LysR family transcriptional regulator [Bordetella genomosp. 13]ARP93369.1 LysR family transcriptional regulator [Bordetella genomosp. 13]
MAITTDSVLSRLRLKQLGLMIALDQHRSLRRAAMDLSMTQSAASKALAEIESVMGGPLFERSRTGILPNDLGRCVIRYAWLLRADVESMCQEVARIQLGRGGHLSVGAIMGSVPNVLVDAVAALREAEPDVSIQILEDTSARLLGMLDQGQLDLVLGRTTVSTNPGQYEYRHLREEPLCIAVGLGHPLARARKVQWNDLRRYSWVVYPSRMPLRALLEREIADAGMALPSNLIETSSVFATVTLLRRCTDLVALLPEEVCAHFREHGMLRVLPIALVSRGQPFGLVTRAGAQPSPVAQRFIDILLRQRPAATPA